MSKKKKTTPKKLKAGIPAAKKAKTKKQPVKKGIFYCEQTIKWSFRILILAAPLIIFPSSDTYGLPKLVFIHLMVNIIMAAWIIKIFSEKKIELVRTWLYLLLFLSVILAIFSTIFAVNSLRSLQGNYMRYEGLFSIIDYVLLFFLALNLIQSKKEAIILIRILIFASALVSIYGIFQYFGLDFLHTPSPLLAARCVSTLGNPLFLGGFLALVLILAINEFFQIIRSPAKSKKYAEKDLGMLYFISISIILIFTALLFTQTRSSWLGFAIGLIILLIIQGRKIITTYWRQILILALLITVILAAIQLSPLRISLRLTSTSVSERTYTWKSSLKIIKKYPLFGCGLDNYGLVFPRFAYLEHYRLKSISGVPATVDKAHNEMIQIASSMGIPALIIFLIILILFFIASSKFLINSLREKEISLNSHLVQGILPAIFAYFVYLQFSFSVIVTSWIFWLLLAIGFSATMRNKNEKISLCFNSEKKLWSMLVSFLFLLTLAIGLFTMYYEFSHLTADMFMEKSESLFRAKRIDEAILEGEKTVSLYPLREDYWLNLGYLYATKVNKKDEWYNKSENSYLRGISLCKEIPNLHGALGSLYKKVGEFQKAENQLKTAIYYNPYDVMSLFELGDTYAKEDKIDEAIENWEKVLKITTYFANVYYNLGISYEKKGDYQKALENYKLFVKNSKDQALTKEVKSRIKFLKKGK